MRIGASAHSGKRHPLPSKKYIALRAFTAKNSFIDFAEAVCAYFIFAR
jgi:hypothetical protein